MSALHAIAVHPDSYVQSSTRSPERKLASLIQEVAHHKESHVSKALDGRVNLHEAILIGGDLFSALYLGFEGAQLLWPALTAVSGFEIISLLCGIFSGVIHIGTALISLKEGIQALQNGDHKLAARLLFDSAGLFGIGLIMILASLAIKVTAFSAIGTFFSVHPWILPVLFFLVSVPVIAEIGHRIYQIHVSHKWGAQLADGADLDELLFNSPSDHPLHLTPLLFLAQEEQNDALIYEKLSQRIELLQADMGIETAIEIFKLLSLHLNQEPTEQQRAILKTKLQAWNQAQYLRALQQLFYTAAFGISLASLSSHTHSIATESTTTLGMAAAEAVPVYLNTAFPFARDVPIVIPKL